MRRVAAFRIALVTLTALIVGAVAGGGPTVALAQQVPATPDPVAVSLDPATTALLVLDITTQTCSSQPSCTQVMVPNIASLLAKARSSGAFVLYSVPPTAPPVLPEVAPLAGDPIIPGVGQDRFFNTNLDSLLQSQGITTIVLVGWRENGSVLYTSVGATLHGYTVVVADDGVSAARDYDIAIGRYQMLTQLSANATNQPLKPNATTLSRSDLITFAPAATH
jgi:nicotinamidase-related amidase